MSLRRRLGLTILVLVTGMVASATVAVLALRAEATAIGRAEQVFSDEIGPVIDLVQVVPDVRQTLPESPTTAALPPDRVRGWQHARAQMSDALGRIQRSLRDGSAAEQIARAESAWEEAASAGDGIVAGPASAEDILAFDRTFRRVRRHVAATLGELQPVVAEPIVAAPARLERVASGLVSVFAAVALGTAVASTLLLRSVVTTVDELRRTARRMADGDLATRATAPPGEFAELATVLNLMAERLSVERDALTVRATRDGLTGVLNSREIKARLAAELDRSRRSGEPVGLIMLDLDRFKAVNDEHGHLGGDQALVSFARTIEAALRPGDVVGRYGGEEFAVVLPGADQEAAGTVAERIRAQVATTPVTLADGTAIRLTTSAGVTSSTTGEDEVDRLVARADEALYRAKREGRDRVVLAGGPGPITRP